MDAANDDLAARHGALLASAGEAATVDAALEVLSRAQADLDAGLSLQAATDHVRAAVFRRCRELTGTHPETARAVIVASAAPACLGVLGDDRVGFHDGKQAIADAIVEWIEQYPSDDQARLRDAVLDIVVPRVRDGSHAATELAITIGYRRDDLVLALAGQLGSADLDVREGALEALDELGIPSELRARCAAVARALAGDGRARRAALRLGALPDLDGLIDRISACPDEGAWWRKDAGLATLPVGFALSHPDDALAQDRAWCVARDILRSQRDRPFVTMQVVGSLAKIESARLPPDLLEWLAGDPAGSAEHALLRVLRCTAPAHRLGWARVDRATLEWLRARAVPRGDPATSSRYWDPAELALRVLLCAGDLWPLELAARDPDAVRRSELLQMLDADPAPPPADARSDRPRALLDDAIASQAADRADTAAFQRVLERDPYALASVDWSERARGWHPAALTALADALAELPEDARTDGAADFLSRLARHASATVRDAALPALGAVAPERLLADARASAGASDVASRASAARALGFCFEIDRPTRSRELEPLMADRNRAVRSAARTVHEMIDRRLRTREALASVLAAARSAPSAEDIARAWLDHELLAHEAGPHEQRALARAGSTTGRAQLTRAWLAYLARDVVVSIREHVDAEPWAAIVGPLRETECVLSVTGAPASLRAAGILWTDRTSWGADLRSIEPGRHLGEEGRGDRNEAGPIAVIDRPPPRQGRVGAGDGLRALAAVEMTVGGETHRLDLVRWHHDRVTLRGSGPWPLRP